METTRSMGFRQKSFLFFKVAVALHRVHSQAHNANVEWWLQMEVVII